MIEQFKEEELIEKAGGRFRLTALIQKRLAVLNRGSLPHVPGVGVDKKDAVQDNLQIVVNEILQGKIYLDMNDNLVERDDVIVPGL